MASSATLATLTTRAQNLLEDSGTSVFPSDTIQEGIRLALEEYNARATSIGRAQSVIGTVTPSASNKEVSLSGLTGLLDVQKIWFPYTASAPEDPPNELRDWALHWDAGVPKLYLGDSALSPGGSDVARVFYTKPHTLNGLDSATSSTFPAVDDGLLVLGGAYYAALGMGVIEAGEAWVRIIELLLAQYRKRLSAIAAVEV
ncbi:MAG: hypothetical protein ACRDGM_04320 [bacterium]